MIKDMEVQGIDWGAARPAARAAIREIFEQRMRRLVGNRIAELAPRGTPDRRHGHYRRWRLTALGPIELTVPRSRTGASRRWVG